jgi:predicted amidohydrolase YtcJ
MAARLTTYLVVAIVAATFIAGIMTGAQRDDSDGPVDLIIENAAVYTGDRSGATAEAVAIRGNQILRVGSNREISRLRRPQTVVVDAKGGAVVPGFNDAHVRLIEGGLTLASIDLSSSSTASETIARIEAWAAARPDARWIVGRGWSADHFRNGLPSRQLLDSAAADRPAVMFGQDETVAWVNSRALALAKITRRTADPDGGTIVREPRTGEPSGVLRGSAVALVTSLIPPPAPRDRAEALSAAIANANALGITSVQTTEAVEDFALIEAARRAGDLTLRVYASLAIAKPLVDADLPALDAVRQKYPDDPVFKAGALSIDVDGQLRARAAALLEPYESEQDADAVAGETAFTPDDLNRTVRLADSVGWQVIAHAHGDRAVRTALTAYAHAARSNRTPARGRRHRIDGAVLVDPADLPRFGPLGVIASMRPERFDDDEDVDDLVALLGKARASRVQPLNGVARSTRLVFGSGWPAGQLNPLTGVLSATTAGAAEETDEPRPTRQPLALPAAMDAYSSTAAWASFDDQRKGSVSAGMLADLVVLTGDIFTTPVEKRSTVAVATTIFDGKIVYQRTPRAETAPAPAPSFQH